MTNPIIEMQDICFSINGIPLLKNVDFKINEGEVCALIGENGSGKTNLMKILSGSFKKDSGSIFYDGNEITIASVTDAQKLGIRMIYHEDNLINHFNVLENIFLGKNITYFGNMFVNKRKQLKIANEVMEYFGVSIDLKSKIYNMSAIDKKIIELIRAVVFDTKLLILDEISANCNLFDSEILFQIMRKLVDFGISIVFISHRMDEVMRVSDRIYIMNEGMIVDEKLNKGIADNIDFNDVLLKMAGRDLANRYPRTKPAKGSIVLEAKNVSLKNTILSNASMYIRKGEIVGITGLYGAGKSSLLKLISGMVEPTEGEIIFEGIPIKGKNNSEFVRKGIAFLNNDGDNNLITQIDVQSNIILTNLRNVTKRGFLNKTECIYIAKKFIDKLNLKNVKPSSDINTLSKGTQQKVVLSKWINANSKVLIFDEPTANLDVVSKIEFYNIVNAMTQNGKSIFMASSDLSELNGMCDRIYVLYKGEIIAEFNEKNKNLINIMQAVIGNKV